MEIEIQGSIQPLRAGNNNTRLFHRMGNVQLNGDPIRSLKINEIKIEGEKKLKGDIVAYFKFVFNIP